MTRSWLPFTYSKAPPQRDNNPRSAGSLEEEQLMGLKYLALLDSKATLVWHADAHGIMSKSSRERWQQLFNTKIVHLLDRQKSLHPDDRERIVDLWSDALEQQVAWETEYRLKQDDLYTYYLSKGVPVFDNNHDLLGWIGVSSNIDERKRSELALMEAKDLAEGANKAKSDFLAMMSHELRTPLTAIMGYCEILSMGVHGQLSFPVEQDLARVLRASNHLLTLINGILDFTKLEGGKLRMRSSVVNLKPLIDASFDIVKPLLDEKGHTYTTLDNCNTARARADVERVQQILVNLLSNAIKFTPRNGTIRTVCHASGKTISVDIIDNGIGMAPGDVANIFEPFVQLDSGISRAHGGTGLGLAISQQLARGMGGDIQVKSVIGEGSVFSLVLPAVQKLD